MRFGPAFVMAGAIAMLGGAPGYQMLPVPRAVG